jgi:hypothetical protein
MDFKRFLCMHIADSVKPNAEYSIWQDHAYGDNGKEFIVTHYAIFDVGNHPVKLVIDRKIYEHRHHQFSIPHPQEIKEKVEQFIVNFNKFENQ